MFENQDFAKHTSGQFLVHLHVINRHLCRIHGPTSQSKSSLVPLRRCVPIHRHRNANYARLWSPTAFSLVRCRMVCQIIGTCCALPTLIF